MLFAANAEGQLEAVATVFDFHSQNTVTTPISTATEERRCEASKIRSGHHALTATRVTADAAGRSKESAPKWWLYRPALYFGSLKSIWRAVAAGPR